MSAPAPSSPGSLTITVSPDVALEAEFAPGAGSVGIVITHPHPLHGGSMHTPVPQCLFDTSRELRVPALRFNFRGVGTSTGTHDEGVGERDDLRAAIDALIQRSRGAQSQTPQSQIKTVILAGWSFGADVALGVETETVGGWFAVAPPLRVVPVEDMVAARSALPKMLAVPEHDQFNQPKAAAETTKDWVNTTISPVAGADHFLAGRLGIIAELFAGFLQAPG